MKNIKLFEQFNPNPGYSGSTWERPLEILDALTFDPDYSGYKLKLKNGGDVKFVVWENPEEDEKWLRSGYGEYNEPHDDVSMPIIAISADGTIFKLSPEEKYSYTYSDDGNSGNAYDNGKLNYPKVKAEFEDSIWNYEG